MRQTSVSICKSVALPPMAHRPAHYYPPVPATACTHLPSSTTPAPSSSSHIATQFPLFSPLASHASVPSPSLSSPMPNPALLSRVESLIFADDSVTQDMESWCKNNCNAFDSSDENKLESPSTPHTPLPLPSLLLPLFSILTPQLSLCAGTLCCTTPSLTCSRAASRATSRRPVPPPTSSWPRALRSVRRTQHRSSEAHCR